MGLKMIEADFDKDLKNQKPEEHIKLISKYISEEYNISERSISVLYLTKEISNIDRIFYWKGKNNVPMSRLLEFKTDWKAFDTTNIVVELVTGVPEECVEEFKSNSIIRVGSEFYEKARSMICNVMLGNIKGKVCYGAMKGNELYDNMMLSYMIMDNKGNPHHCMKIKCKELSEYCYLHRREFPLYMTVSKDKYDQKWGAVGLLIPYDRIKDESFVENLL